MCSPRRYTIWLGIKSQRSYLIFVLIVCNDLLLRDNILDEVFFLESALLRFDWHIHWESTCWLPDRCVSLVVVLFVKILWIFSRRRVFVGLGFRVRLPFLL